MNNGDRVRDRITGFVGIVTGKVEYITGCNQVLVSPPVKEDGSYVNSQWIDDDRCEVIDADAVALTVNNPGFGEPAPIR